MTERDLGNLRSVHGIAPAFMQRAAILIIISFVFFVMMTIAFTLRRNIGYFLLATAFLIIQFFTLFGWIVQKRTLFKLYENGFAYRKQVCLWDEIESITVKPAKPFEVNSKTDCEVVKISGERIVLSEAIQGVENIVERIRTEIVKSEKLKVNDEQLKQ